MKDIKTVVHRDNNSNYIVHYGVRGMKWKIKNTADKVSDTVVDTATEIGDGVSDVADEVALKQELDKIKKKYGYDVPGNSKAAKTIRAAAEKRMKKAKSDYAIAKIKKKAKRLSRDAGRKKNRIVRDIKDTAKELAGK